MTTEQIEIAADRGNLASGDIDLKFLLRRNVVQKFLLDVGDVTWRRRYGSITTDTSVRVHDLPDDFFKMVRFFRKPATWTANQEPSDLLYIGEDPLLVSQAEIATEPGTPTGYYITTRTSDGEWKAVKFDIQPDTVETIPYIYLAYPQFDDDKASVELNKWIPEPFQFALVCGLRAEIYLDRYGRGDKRFEQEDGRYREWAERAMEHRDLGSRNMAHFVS